MGMINRVFGAAEYLGYIKALELTSEYAEKTWGDPIFALLATPLCITLACDGMCRSFLDSSVFSLYFNLDGIDF